VIPDGRALAGPGCTAARVMAVLRQPIVDIGAEPADRAAMVAVLFGECAHENHAEEHPSVASGEARDVVRTQHCI